LALPPSLWASQPLPALLAITAPSLKHMSAASNHHRKHFLTAMLFIVFDIEIVFLYPWAVTFDKLGLFGLVEMAIFIGTVFVAYAYVWRRGGLEWD
jgi:NADH:ubiquinone oxidoreductase subunit 3 (subunit A)